MQRLLGTQGYFVPKMWTTTSCSKDALDLKGQMSVLNCRCLFEYGENSPECVRSTNSSFYSEAFAANAVRETRLGTDLEWRKATTTIRRNQPTLWRRKLILPNVYSYKYAESVGKLGATDRAFVQRTFQSAHLISGHFQYGLHEIGHQRSTRTGT